jgi:hypothetical protein
MIQTLKVNAKDYNQRDLEFVINFTHIGEISLNDFSNITNNLDLSTREMEKFIDVATSKYAFQNP